MAIQRRRVVVTGMGAITPLGNTLLSTWKRVIEGESGVVDLATALHHQGLTEAQLSAELELIPTMPCQVAAPVRDMNHDARTARFVQFACAAAREALDHAHLLDWLRIKKEGGDPNESKEAVDPLLLDRRSRVGVCVASGMSSVREISQAYCTLQATYRKLSPHFVPKVLSNSASSRVAIEFNLQGPNHTVATACAAGTHAVGDAMRFIQNGMADIMVAGGAESAIDPLSVAGFCRLRALSTSFNDDPLQASRPFDAKRDGFVMGEGAATLVLEELNHALERDAPILAEVTGYGVSGDAFHVTAPDSHGRGAIRCMQEAIREHFDDSVERDGCAIQYVNAHATSTPKGDEIEAAAIDKVFQGQNVWVSSTKGATGHLLGAAGALEAAMCVQALIDQTLPPNVNLEESDIPLCSSIQLLGNKCIHEPSLHAILSNSFGFGGTNASIIFQRWSGQVD